MVWARRDLKRSYSCNPELLVFMRERRGWTQRQLAEASGYSERLINKAESGRPISAVAVDDLAETLSTGEEPIYPEDLISDPVALAKEYVAAHYIHQRDLVRAVRHFIDDNIVHRMVGDPAVIPFAGERRGFAEFEEAFRIFWSLMEAPQGHDYEACHTYVAQGNEVIVWAESWLHPIGRPMQEPMRLSQRLKFRRGKLVIVEIVFDTRYGEQVLQPHNSLRAAGSVDPVLQFRE